MPDPQFDLDQWMSDNGYDDPGNMSDEMGDYTSGDESLYPGLIGEIWNVFDMLTGDGADPIAGFMADWSMSNPDASNEAFAAELFEQLFWQASPEAQQEFLYQWNNTYFGNAEYPQLGGGEDLEDYIFEEEFQASISEAAEMWGQDFGAMFDFDVEFDVDGNALENEMLALISGVSDLANQYNAQWGSAGWAELTTEAEGEELQYQLEAQALLNSYQNQLYGIELDGKTYKSQYKLGKTAERTKEAARGLTKRSTNLLSEKSTDLENLRNQLQALGVSSDAASAMFSETGEINQMEWENYLFNLFDPWSGEQDLAYTTLLQDIGNLVWSYNIDVLDESSYQEGWLWDTLAQLMSAEGMIPPTEAGGWEGTGEGFECVTPGGNFGITCPNGACATSIDLCPIYGCTNPDATNYNPDATVDDGSCDAPEGGGDDDGDDDLPPVADPCEEFGLMSCPACSPTNNCVPELSACVQCEDEPDLPEDICYTNWGTEVECGPCAPGSTIPAPGICVEDDYDPNAQELEDWWDSITQYEEDPEQWWQDMYPDEDYDPWADYYQDLDWSQEWGDWWGDWMDPS